MNTTTLDTIAQTVVRVLSNLDAYKNQSVRVHDFFVSQSEILAILEQETGEKFTIENADIGELLKKCGEGLAKGEYTFENIFGVVKGNVWGEESSARWGEEDDTVAVGVPKKDLREEIKKVL
jgi:hypothetical protein